MSSIMARRFAVEKNKKAEFGVPRVRKSLLKCNDEMKRPVQRKNLKLKRRLGN